jgi:large subunit ribosomal protein L29
VKAKELRDLTEEELQEKERELSQELFNLRFQKATGELGNTAMLGKVSKDLARIKTVLREMKNPLSAAETNE